MCVARVCVRQTSFCELEFTLAEKLRILEEMNLGTKREAHVAKAFGISCSALSTLIKKIPASPPYKLATTKFRYNEGKLVAAMISL